MSRYSFLDKYSVYEALNRLRSSFLAAKDGEEVEVLIRGLLSNDERLKIGRRIQVAYMLLDGYTQREIADELKVGLKTVTEVLKKLEKHPKCFELLLERDKKVEQTYKRKSYRKSGGSKLIYKKSEYTGFKRKQVKR